MKINLTICNSGIVGYGLKHCKAITMEVILSGCLRRKRLSSLQNKRSQGLLSPSYIQRQSGSTCCAFIIQMSSPLSRSSFLSIQKFSTLLLGHLKVLMANTVSSICIQGCQKQCPLLGVGDKQTANLTYHGWCNEYQATKLQLLKLFLLL